MGGLVGGCWLQLSILRWWLLVPTGTGLCTVLALAPVQVSTSWLQTQLLWLVTSPAVALKPLLLLYEAL